MKEALKAKSKAVFKYTWPYYIVSAIVISVGFYFIFNIAHPIADYKTLTVFVSGEVYNQKGLEENVLNKFKDNELRVFSTIEADPDEPTYNARLNLPGVGSSDILIIPESKFKDIVLSGFAIELTDSLINTYYLGATFYEQNNVKYGVKLNKETVKDYMRFTSEDQYMILNYSSANMGEYGKSQIKEHNNALNLVKEWSI